MSATASRLAVLLFTDIVGSTDLKSRIGAPAYSGLLERHNVIFESICRDLRGEVLKHTGDGFFAAFPTASDAVRAALRFQHAMRAEPWPTPVTARVGIHVGEVADVQLAGRSDVIGVAADVAARVMSLADGGQILLTRSAFNDARQFVSEHPAIDGQPMPSLVWVAHGSYLLKGIDEPLEIFEVVGNGIAPLGAPAGDDRARRVVPHDQEPTLGWRPAIGLAVPQRPGWALEKRLGEGGFGEVWLGHHERTKQRRVFKFCFDADRLRSFKRELTLFRLLREALGERPDIARLYEVKLDEPPFFLESEWTEGGNLVDWAEARGGIATVGLEQRLEIVAKVSDAVAAAHSVGILHKDIKPSNVLVQELPGGTIQPRLADFGIGFLADRSQLAARHITETGFTVITQTSGSSMTGTRLYSPPEVIAGKPFTTQGDIYALGVLLYQMAVGDLNRPLAEGWEREIGDELIREDIATCCDGDPNRRPGGAGEVAQRIRALPQRRQAERERVLHAQAAEKRRRLLRRSIAGSVIMGLLVVTIAASSAFYIRRVRGAQRAESRQRQRAEGAEKDAQAEAARAKRQAAYYNAQYLLGQSRLKEAYEKALEANEPPARWEDGRLLQEIVSRARQHWQVVSRIGDSALNQEVGPGLGCFVRRDEKDWVVVIPRASAAEVFRVPSGEHVGRIALGTTAGPMCPGTKPGQVLISAGKTLMLWDVSTMKQLLTVELEQPLMQVVTHPNALTIAALDNAGVVTVHELDSLKVLARTRPTFPDRPNTTRAVLIDLSPSGQRVVAHSGLWTDGVILWDWKTDHTDTRRLMAHSAIFEDENTVAGYWNWGMGMDESAIWRIGLKDGPRSFDPAFFHDLQGKTSIRFTLWALPDTGRRRVGIVGREGVDIRSFPNGAVVSSDRYSGILPLSRRNPVVVAHDLQNELLLLQGDELLLLQRYGLAPWERAMSGWSLCTSDRGMLTCETVRTTSQQLGAHLTLTPFDGSATQTYSLEWPNVAGVEILPWGIWSPPDGSFVAVLRQEAEAGDYAGTIGGKYLGKWFTIYDPAGWPERSAELKIKRQFKLEEYQGRTGRDNHMLIVTPDGQVAAHVTGRLEMARYRVADGTLLSRQSLGPWAEASQDGRLIAAGGNAGEPVKVWDIASGKVVFSTPDVGTSNKGCFSQDSRQLCVAWATEEVVWYDLTTGKRAHSIKSKLWPTAVPATGDRFVAFLTDTTTTGDTVLASSLTGEVTAMLNRGAYINNEMWFDPSGMRLAMVKYRDLAELVCSLTVGEARAALQSVGSPASTTTRPASSASPMTTTTRPTSAPVVIAQIPRPAAPTTTRVIPPGTVAWEDAASYLNKSVVIEFKVVDTRNIQTRCFLNPAPFRRGNFATVVNSSTFDKWPQPPETWFYNKTIRVRGTIVLFRGAPEIEVDDPKQIEIVESK